MADQRPVVANPDFKDIKQDIITYFKNDSTFSDYDFTGSALNTLVDILAYNTHYNNLTANYLVNEMFLDTALMRNNVLSIAKMLNYQPRSARGSKGTITLRIPKVGGAIVLSPEIPSSPPKNTVIMIQQAAINSPIPRLIMAKTVPAFLVEKLPMIVANPSPTSPPTNGSKGKGSHKDSFSTMFIT